MSKAMHLMVLWVCLNSIIAATASRDAVNDFVRDSRACVKLALRITCGRARVICGTPTRALAAQQNRDERVSLVDGVGDDAGF